MEIIDKIKNSVVIYIVDYSLEWSELLENGIDCGELVEIKKFSTGEDFIKYITNARINKRKTHIVLLGYSFYDEKNQTLMNGIEILEAIKRFKPFFKVIMLANEDEQEYGGYVKKIGVEAIVNKDDNALLRINNYAAILRSRHAIEYRKKDLKRVLFLWITLLVLLAITYFFMNNIP
ncbi:MAG: hypothetical protein PWR03_815 [Tenuifilum sp.]|uniref:hypothetical protein n=1 Tax=Tenuifilum sp. TaxID=2760880 RepID=UPI0024ABF707|nr:hypothetical protein [Tenuifilum sp.]MDI3526632.1 hypothetical protein [Tenuifilum sp.]